MTGPTLTAPFKNAKKLNKGGTTLTYIPASEVIDRLNAVLGVGAWRYSCEVEHADENFIVVKGRLTACGGLYEQFGGQVINKKKDGSVLDLGDDYKGAASDAFKKCAQMIGVGLYLALDHEPLSAKLSDEPPSPDDGTSPPLEAGPVDTSGGDVQGEATTDASTAADNAAVPPGDNEEVAGGDGEVPPAADSPEQLLDKAERQKLIGRFNNLPLEQKAAALGEKRRLGITDWFTAPDEAISLMRACVAELEPV